MSAGRVDPSAIAGLELRPAFSADDPRGRFVKLHSEGDDRFAQETWREIYYSTSGRGVVRGMHLQLPPHDHVKAVHCLAGRAVDVVVDVRAGSPTLGAHATFDLDAERPELVVVPKGCAHGFQALEPGTVMVYLVGTAHAPDADSGIRFDSFGFDWPLPPTEVSARDQGLPTLAEFTAAGHGPWGA